MIYATLKTVHVLSIIVWIGGMVFAQKGMMWSGGAEDIDHPR